MKKLFVWALLGLLPASGKSQSSTKGDRHNELKINLPSLAIKTVSIQYERGFGAFSGALGLRVGPETAMPFRGFLKSASTGDQAVNQAINSLRTSNFALTPEVRYYLSGTADHGFYFSLFGRYATSGISSSFQKPDDDFPDGMRPVAITGTYRSGAVGVMAGVKWRIRDRVSIDWWLAGPMYASGTVSVDVQTDLSMLDADSRQQISDDVKRGIVVGGQQINGTATFRNDGFTIEAPLSMVQLRTGLAIGIAF